MQKTNPSIDYLDLRGTPCPLNYIRCSLALEKLQNDQSLQVDIDKGEPEETIISGLSKKGYIIEIVSDNKYFITILVNYLDS